MNFKQYYKLFLENYAETDLDSAYELFNKEYLATTGKSWTKEKFLQRASNWKFYGDSNGYVALRPQRSGFYKLVGTAGSNKSKYKAFLEIESLNLPVWGMVSKDIANLLLKRNYRMPTSEEIESLKMLLSSNYILGDAKLVEHLPDGGIVLDYPDVGRVVKYFVGSEPYWEKLKTFM
jgi:hypothetical protein